MRRWTSPRPRTRASSPWRTPPPVFPEPPKQLTVPRPPELELAVALTEAGLFPDAAEEVESRASRIRSPEQALPFAHALLSLGEYGYAHAIAARHLWGRAFGEINAFEQPTS